MTDMIQPILSGTMPLGNSPASPVVVHSPPTLPPPADTELKPRSYMNLLALVEAAWVSSTAAPANQAPAPPAGGVGAISQADADTYKEREIAESLRLVVLGKTPEGKVKVFSHYHKTTSTIGSVAHMHKETLFQIAGPPARDRISDASDPPPGSFTLSEAKCSIALLAGFRTITDDSEAGPGCWAGLDSVGKSNNAIVIAGNSEAAVWDGNILAKVDQPLACGRLLNFDQKGHNWYDFNHLNELMKQAAEADFRTTAAKDCAEILGRWRWRSSDSPLALTGLLFASWVQTIWDWRPMVAVTGPTNSGKSMLCKMMKGLFGHLGKSCSDQTAAGVRQMMKSSAKVFMLDEVDAEDRQKAEEMDRLFKMLRASSRGDAIVRGTAGQTAIESVLRHLVWVLGIQINTDNQADKNRLITAELLKPAEGMEGKLVIPDDTELTDLGQRMLATAVYCAREARRLATKIKDTRVAGVDSRVIENYAVPAAMLAVIAGGEVESEARTLLVQMVQPLAHDEVNSGSDERNLMEAILSATVQLERDRKSVGQLLDHINRHPDSSDAEIYATKLQMYGLKIDRFTGKEGDNITKGAPCFLIAYKIVAEHLLKNTKWGGRAINQILRQIRGAGQNFVRRSVSGHNEHVVAIPLYVLHEDYLAECE